MAGECSNVGGGCLCGMQDWWEPDRGSRPISELDSALTTAPALCRVAPPSAACALSRHAKTHPEGSGKQLKSKPHSHSRAHRCLEGVTMPKGSYVHLVVGEEGAQSSLSRAGKE